MSHFQTDETTFHALMAFSRWILFEIEEHQKNVLLLQSAMQYWGGRQVHRSTDLYIYHARQQQQNTDARKDDISHLLSFLFIYKSVNITLTEWDNDIRTRVPPSHWNSWDHNTTIKSALLFNVVLIIIRITTYIIS